MNPPQSSSTPKKSKGNILVVGGAGFIGSHVVKMLKNAGYSPIVFDNLSTGSTEAFSEADPHGTIIHGCLSDKAAIDKVFLEHAIDAVIHFAAYIDVGESVRDPAKYYINNVVNTVNLLESMRGAFVKHLIFSSTAAIFGVPHQEKIGEDHPKEPINPYGETKLIVEKILQDYDAAYGFKSTALRYFNAAGGDPEGIIKNHSKKQSNLIPLVLRHLKGTGSKEITIYGTDYPTHDGTCIRDYIHIEDLGSAHILALERLLNGGSSKNYNLGNETGFSVREVIFAAEKVTGLKVKTIEGARRPGDPAALIADSTKAKQELRWSPKYSLNEMISHAWKAL